MKTTMKREPQARWWLATCGCLLWAASASAFYNPQMGRWLNRDPIEEGGGASLTVFVFNQSVSRCDPVGLQAAPGVPGSPRALSDPCAKFEAWYQQEKSNMSWLKELPNCPCAIKVRQTCRYDIIGAGPGAKREEESLAEVSHDKDAGWYLDSTVHPGAKWCIRSGTTQSGGKQQCCYDGNGKLITDPGAGAGTADRSGGIIGHILDDWQPAMLAIKCDKLNGNENCIRKYLEVRPANNGNNCPRNPPAGEKKAVQ